MTNINHATLMLCLGISLITISAQAANNPSPDISPFLKYDLAQRGEACQIDDLYLQVGKTASTTCTWQANNDDTDVSITLHIPLDVARVSGTCTFTPAENSLDMIQQIAGSKAARTPVIPFFDSESKPMNLKLLDKDSYTMKINKDQNGKSIDAVINMTITNYYNAYVAFHGKKFADKEITDTVGNLSYAHANVLFYIQGNHKVGGSTLTCDFTPVQPDNQPSHAVDLSLPHDRFIAPQPQ